MYKHYGTSDDVFVDREEHIEWMNNALERCKTESVVLHLKGIGGIGKSSLLNHWVNTHEKTVRLDCYQYSDFFQRLNILAKGAVVQGIKLQRFDILWQIRQRFVEGVEPVKEEGRTWAKEVVMAIPFIGSLASIGSAISAVGSKVTPKLKGKYGAIGKWLQEQLGKNYVECLLEVLWKEPRRAEFLYLSAFLEDINDRDDQTLPVLFLFDHFEHIDDLNAQWRYRKKRISESELWTIFLSNLSNCVGVLASRRPATKSKGIHIEETELLELDRESCFEMLELQEVANKELQERIVSVSGGNPFVLDTICDMLETGDVSIEDLDCLQADTLEDVRLKTWRRLFSRAEGLYDMVNRAGLVPHFNKDVMTIIAPSMTGDQWDRLKGLSFVRERSDGTYVLHELAKELVVSELGNRLGEITKEVADRLENAYEKESDLSLLGMAISVLSHFSSDDSISKLRGHIDDLVEDGLIKEALLLLNSVILESDDGHFILRGLQGKLLWRANRIVEAEIELRSSIEYFQSFSGNISLNHKQFFADCFTQLGYTLYRLLDINNARNAFQEAINLQRDLVSTAGHEHAIDLGLSLIDLSRLILEREPDTAERLALEAIRILNQTDDKNDVIRLAKLTKAYDTLGLARGNLFKWDEEETALREALKIQQEILNLKPDSPSVLNRLAAAFNNLGYAIWKWGREKETLDLIEQSEYYNRKAAALQLDTYRWSLAISLQNCGFQYLRMRNLILAERYFREATDLLENRPPDVEGYWLGQFGYVLSGLSYVCLEKGEFQESIELVNKAVEIRRELMKIAPWNPGFGFALNVSGIVHSVTKNKAIAEESFKEAVEILEGAITDPQHVPLFLASSKNNYGVHLLRLGRLSEAIDMLGEVVQILRDYMKLAPELHPGWFAVILTNLAVAYKQNDNLGDAEKLLKEALNLESRLMEIAPESYHYFREYTLRVYSSLCIQKGEGNRGESLLSEASEMSQRFSDLVITSYSSILESDDEARFLVIY